MAVFRSAIRSYQTAVLREFLPCVIGADLTGFIMQGDRRYYRPHRSSRSSLARGA